jgi:CBS domain containing-hemolysin-like protein
VTLDLNASSEQILAVARETAHTRMPVWEATPTTSSASSTPRTCSTSGACKGVVTLMDAMYEPTFVPPDMSVARLMRIFKRLRRPMAVVQGDHNKFLGIVTLEDILEEIVGEIEDEHDVPGRPGATTVTKR